MLQFVLRRLGVMALTMIVLTVIVFFLVNLEPNLRKLSISQTNIRATDEMIESWLVKAGYREPFAQRYGEWLGVVPREVREDAATGKPFKLAPKCSIQDETGFNGVLQGYFGCSTKFRDDVANKLGPALKATGILMFWVMLVMVPAALIIGILAGMKEGSKTDRSLSVVSIASTATPEYVSGVIFTVIFASWLGILNGPAATAASKGITFYNFTLPVMTMALYGMGYIARITRASMAEVMTAQYIRTARLKGLSFRTEAKVDALRNALIEVEESGPAEPYDFVAFVERKKSA